MIKFQKFILIPPIAQHCENKTTTNISELTKFLKSDCEIREFVNVMFVVKKLKCIKC